MNRTIKFRAWDEKENRMYVNVQFDANYYHPRRIKGPTIDCLKLVLLDNVIIQQFTGLKDKNNKEIYEGDIVKWASDDDDYYGNFEVKYNEVNCEFEPFGSSSNFTSWIDNLEILGNIYENKELLKNE